MRFILFIIFITVVNDISAKGHLELGLNYGICAPSIKERVLNSNIDPAPGRSFLFSNDISFFNTSTPPRFSFQLGLLLSFFNFQGNIVWYDMNHQPINSLQKLAFLSVGVTPALQYTEPFNKKIVFRSSLFCGAVMDGFKEENSLRYPEKPALIAGISAGLMFHYRFTGGIRYEHLFKKYYYPNNIYDPTYFKADQYTCNMLMFELKIFLGRNYHYYRNW